MNTLRTRFSRLPSRMSFGALALLVAALPACDSILGPGNADSRVAIDELPRHLTATEAQVLSSSNRFGMELLGAVLAEEPDRTHFISPLSASMLLAILLNGAGGDTYDVVRRTLRLQGVAEPEINATFGSLIDLLGRVDPAVGFQLANGIWYRDGQTALRGDYIARVQEHFGAAVEGLDFDDPAAADTINAWVREATGGRIDEMVPQPIPFSWIAVAMNAIHFDADWTWRFDPDSTRTEPFHLIGGDTEPVPMMQQTGEFAYHSSGTLQAVDLPYGGEAFAMTVIVPRGTSTVAGVLAELARGGWDALVDDLTPQGLKVALPRFEIEWERNLNDPLTALGMGPAFGATGDWSRMFEAQQVLALIKQKSYVRVDEAGTEAAAATMAVWFRSAGGPPVIRADRPFLFAIRERLSGAVLFMGAYMAPPA